MNGLKPPANIAVVGALFIRYRKVAAGWTVSRVATLSFMMFCIGQSIWHRGLVGHDMCVCSFVVIYTLCTVVGVRNILKLVGGAPSRSAYNMNSVGAQTQNDTNKCKGK